jgi:hypothetical protein
MMGQQTGGQERLFCTFNLEDHIPTFCEALISASTSPNYAST